MLIHAMCAKALSAGSRFAHPSPSAHHPVGASHRPSVSIITDSSDAPLPLHSSFGAMPLGIWTVHVQEAARTEGKPTVVFYEEVIAGPRSIAMGQAPVRFL
ncbi:hypothetical protein [Paraburkholderia diazotrophica]|uniref:hypothetical protein n=1 Tax=Paraburkholderia diazotrophica TaxID=667676 RepID=UPI0015A69E89|nr:hypothetical protein [Paraburkholderia diazotrophica]